MGWYQRLVDKVGGILFYSIIGFLIVFSGPIIFIIQISLDAGHKAVVVTSIPSPDGKWSAVIHEVTTLPPNRRVSIIPSDQSFSLNEHWSFLRIRGGQDLPVTWLNDHVLEINLPEGAKTDLRHPNVGDITIDYK